MVRRALAVAVCALAFAATADAATPQQLTIPMSDGVQLACSLTLPDTATPVGTGPPGVMLFHGLGGKHQDMEPVATGFLAPAGYASLACDARGHGASGGQFGLDGPRDVQDTKELFSWFAGRINSQNIGALGISLGGGAVWNALTNAVPFKAAVPIITWTNLATALAPQDLSKSGLVSYLAGLVPTSRWAPDLLAASPGLTTSADLSAAKAVSATRSPLARLGSITTPTLLIQGRHDFLFDIDQALAAYRSLGGPKALYVGDIGHSPAPNPATEQPTLFGTAVKWLDRYVKGTPNGIEKTKVVLAHDPWDGKTTAYAGLPPTKAISVNLPGSTTISGATGKVVRSVRITGGPHETFGDSTVTIKYSGAKAWDRLVAVLAVQGSTTPITAGGTKVSGASGTATIRLMDEAVKVAAGKKLVLYLSSTSVAQSGNIGLYLGAVSDPAAQITIGKVTLKLSVLKKAVSGSSASRRLAFVRATPGITKTQIVLGATGPLTGTESAYEPVMTGAKAYFDYVNAHGGVYGRKIVYKIEDDQYDPVQTVQKTQKLVEQDKVFAIFNSIGTEHSIAVRDYLNERKVPQLFVGSGATTLGTSHAKYPWTLPLLPNNVAEGTLEGRQIAKQHPGAKIAVLYENDVYGQELLAGLKKGLGPHAKQIVSAVSYALLDTDVLPQIQQLKASGADTFVIFALPKQAIQAFVGAAKLGWKPYEYLSSVSIDPAVMQIVRLNSDANTGVGTQSMAFLHDPTNPTQQRSPGVKLYLSIMKKYLSNEDPKAAAHIYGMMAAYAMVDALKQAGKNPTRAGVLKAATHLNEKNPFLLPGLTLTTSPRDYFPIGKAYLVKFQHGYWNVLGKPLQVK